MSVLSLLLIWVALTSCNAVHPVRVAQEPLHHETETPGHTHGGPEADTVTSMAGSHAHLGPHFRWTTLRPANPEDEQRADTILRNLREALALYRDYRRAIADGYEPFLPHVQQPHYHFTSTWRGFKAAFRFNPEQPTSLLYRKTADGYELEGAMFTAPKRAQEADLHERIPLSTAQWHAHVNICLPQRKDMGRADWTRFGPKGSILTEGDCERAGGRFLPQLFGWMVHVYPFAKTAEAIWTH